MDERLNNANTWDDPAFAGVNNRTETQDGERPGLREAAERLLAELEPDENWEGEFVDWLVPHDRILDLRAALATPTPDDRDREVERIAAVLEAAPYSILVIGSETSAAKEAAVALYDAGLRASGGTETWNP